MFLNQQDLSMALWYVVVLSYFSYINQLNSSIRFIDFYIFYQYDRTKVECAGFCLSLQTCHAFRWIGSNEQQPNNICQRLDKDSLCLTSDNSPIEIYVDSNENFPDCAGSYELNCCQLAVLSRAELALFKQSCILLSFLCQVDCKWGSYGEWSSCSKTCGGGEEYRTRQVATPASNGGKDCEGDTTETMTCNDVACPGSWLELRQKTETYVF